MRLINIIEKEIKYNFGRNKNSNKLHLDKYYTSIGMAKYCINKTFEIIGKENITEIIEPSAGNGSFSNQLDCISYDIEPECKGITKQDFLELEMEYKKGRLFIGNPPYGRSFRLGTSFYAKCCKYGDYISFILPIRQLNNSRHLHQFDLIYSENLGIVEFSGKNVHCCFNIYKRPNNGKLNPKPKNKLNDITIVKKDPRSDKYKNTINYDLRISAWGKPVGRILKDDEHLNMEFKIIINNNSLKSEIINFFKTVDWGKHTNQTLKNTNVITMTDVVETIKKHIKEIQ